MQKFFPDITKIMSTRYLTPTCYPITFTIHICTACGNIRQLKSRNPTWPTILQFLNLKKSLYKYTILKNFHTERKYV